MKALSKSLPVYVATIVVSWAMVPNATASCKFDLKISNGFASVPINIAEIKTSTNWPVYKTQWEGNPSSNIPVGDIRTFNFTADADCKDGLGENQLWDLRIFRVNGNQHNCTEVDNKATVTLKKPDKCIVSN